MVCKLNLVPTIMSTYYFSFNGKKYESKNRVMMLKLKLTFYLNQYLQIIFNKSYIK